MNWDTEEAINYLANSSATIYGQLTHDARYDLVRTAHHLDSAGVKVLKQLGAPVGKGPNDIDPDEINWFEVAEYFAED